MLLERALHLALRAHGGQLDKGGHPYILHALRVMLRGRDDGERLVGLLHDVLEDSAVTAADLVKVGVPPRVIEAVETLTRRRDESYDAFIERVAGGPRLARQVKLYDLEDNCDLSRLGQALTQADIDRIDRRYMPAVYRLMATLGLCGTCDGEGEYECPYCAGDEQVNCGYCEDGNIICQACDGQRRVEE